MKKQTSIENLADDFLDHLQAKIQTSKDETIRDNLGDTLENDWGLTHEAKSQAAALFYEAVKNKDSALRVGLENLLREYGQFIIDDEFDVIENLADYAAELEAAIAYTDSNNQQLAQDIQEQLSEQNNLDENTVSALWNSSSDFSDLERKIAFTKQSDRRPRKSLDLEGGITYSPSGEINEDGSFAQTDSEDHTDPQMRQYLRFLK